jgi:YegS/Rv2252/BmrU family lipid kinase
MDKKYNLLIVNPAAGKGRADRFLESFVNILKSAGLEYRIVYTEYPGHAVQIVKESLSEKGLFIYSIGGDGTLNEVINGAVNTEAVVINIPAGSGNDFIKSVSDLRDPVEIFEKSLSSQIKVIDTMKINGRFCVNIASAGLDAVVAYNTNSFKKLPLVSGSAAYLLGIFKSLIKFNFYNLEINIDGNDYSRELLLAAFANGRYYGGGIMAAPDALTDDGYIDICLVKKLSRLRILSLLSRYRKGTHKELPQVEFVQGKKITISSREKMKINIDGEIFEDNTLNIEIIPMSLKMAGF